MYATGPQDEHLKINHPTLTIWGLISSPCRFSFCIVGQKHKPAKEWRFLSAPRLCCSWRHVSQCPRPRQSVLETPTSVGTRGWTCTITKTLAHWAGKMGIGIEKCHQHLTTRKLRGGSWACRCPAAASSNLAGSRRGAAAACSPRRRINMSPPWWRTGALEHWGAPHLRGKACTSLANTSLFFLFFKLDI